MKNKLFGLTVACLLNHSVFAKEGIQCPSVPSIIAGGLSDVQVNITNSYKDCIGNQISNYDTNNKWQFYIEVDDNDITPENAQQKALAAMSKLFYASGPFPYDGYDVCMYLAHDEKAVITAYTFTPPVVGLLGKIKVR